MADAVTRDGEAVQDMKKDNLAAVTAVETETVTIGWGSGGGIFW